MIPIPGVKKNTNGPRSNNYAYGINWLISFSFGIVYVFGHLSILELVLAGFTYIYHLSQSSLSHPSPFPLAAVGLARDALVTGFAAALGAGELELDRETPIPPDWKPPEDETPLLLLLLLLVLLLKGDEVRGVGEFFCS